jgi:hypothetical protein
MLGEVKFRGSQASVLHFRTSVKHTPHVPDLSLAMSPCGPASRRDRSSTAVQYIVVVAYSLPMTPAELRDEIDGDDSEQMRGF